MNISLSIVSKFNEKSGVAVPALSLAALSSNVNELGVINCSTLCIFGDLDKMVPVKAGTKMSERIKNSETKIISNCGHMIIFEKAFEMRKIVKDFLTK